MREGTLRMPVVEIGNGGRLLWLLLSTLGELTMSLMVARATACSSSSLVRPRPNWVSRAAICSLLANRQATMDAQSIGSTASRKY